MKTFKEWLKHQGYAPVDDVRLDGYLQYAIKEIADSYQHGLRRYEYPLVYGRSPPEDKVGAAYDCGYSIGKSGGHKVGYLKGYKAGFQEGDSIGYNRAHKDLMQTIDPSVIARDIDMRPYATQINDARDEGYHRGYEVASSITEIGDEKYTNFLKRCLKEAKKDRDNFFNEGYKASLQLKERDAAKNQMEIDRLKQVEAEATESYDRGYKIGKKEGYNLGSRESYEANAKIEKAARECAMTWLGGEVYEAAIAIDNLRSALGISVNEVIYAHRYPSGCGRSDD